MRGSGTWDASSGSASTIISNQHMPRLISLCQTSLRSISFSSDGLTESPLADPDENTVRALFPKLKESLGEPGSLVLIWSGHGVASPNGLRLVARDSEPPEPYSAIGVADLISACARSGANQLLLIIDTCYSGEAVEASSLAAAILEQNPPDSKRIWVGVLTSCLKLETAANGLLGERLRHLLEDGPEDSDLRVRWSRHNE
jgi:hypothetical protein